MSISPLNLLSHHSIFSKKKLGNISLRHLLWHALQADSQDWEAEEFALCLKEVEGGFSRGASGKYEKQTDVLVMRMSHGFRLDSVMKTPILKKLMTEHRKCGASLLMVLPKKIMKILHLSELRHPIASGFYTPEEYESFLRQSVDNKTAYKVKKI